MRRGILRACARWVLRGCILYNSGARIISLRGAGERSRERERKWPCESEIEGGRGREGAGANGGSSSLLGLTQREPLPNQ